MNWGNGKKMLLWECERFVMSGRKVVVCPKTYTFLSLNNIIIKIIIIQ